LKAEASKLICAEEQARNRWYKMRYHPEQARLWASKSRFNVVPAGRRSGKTEIVGKRKLITRAMIGTKFPVPRFFVGAPTRDQAKRIYWEDLKAMVGRENMLRDPSETQLVIYLLNMAEIHVLGMDKPERIEGSPWDGGVLDEFANMKKDTWSEHVRPALSDRSGWCDFIGVPEGRNHYYILDQMAKERFLEDSRKGRVPEWNPFWWPSSDILPPNEIEAAKRDLDELTYMQEYEASFIHFAGLAYYAYNERKHLGRLAYDPKVTLIFCFDFNVSPGVAAICQQQQLPNPSNQYGTGIIGEVWIPRSSNTIKVCDRLIEDWGNHQGRIICYGDASGGAKGTAKILGSDWQLIKQKLWGHFGKNRVYFKVPLQNPRERDRVNSVNARLLSVTGEIRLMIDPAKAPHVVQDFEGTMVTEDGTGAIEKTKDRDRSHLTDAIGYHIYREFPLKKQYQTAGQKFWK
jgi:hypothetical protein